MIIYKIKKFIRSFSYSFVEYGSYHCPRAEASICFIDIAFNHINIEQNSHRRNLAIIKSYTIKYAREYTNYAYYLGSVSKFYIEDKLEEMYLKRYLQNKSKSNTKSEIQKLKEEYDKQIKGLESYYREKEKYLEHLERDLTVRATKLLGENHVN